MNTLGKQIKEYASKVFNSEEAVVDFLNNSQEELYIESITHTGDVYTIFYYKKIWK